MRRLAPAGAALLAAALLAGCSSGKTASHGPKLRGAITYAVLAPVERVGPLGDRGRDLVRGAKLAVAEINGTTGVLGKRLELQVMDDGCAPEVAYEAAKGVAENGTTFAGALGGVCDAATAREVAVIDGSGVPFLVTSANGADVVTPDVRHAYLMNGTLYQQALSTTFWMNYQHAQRLAIVGDASSASRTLVKDVVADISGQTPTLVSLQQVPVGKTDLATEAKAALASHPNFVYWAGGPVGGGAFAKALHEAGYKGAFTVPASSEDPRFLKAAGPGGAQGAFVMATSTPENTPMAAKWLRKFRATYHRDPGLDALQAYDAVRTLAQAARQGKTANPSTVTASLTNLSPNFTTFLGPVRFARDHTLLYDNRVILVVKNGKFAWKRSLRTDSLQ